jgi:hypothetical protein
MVQGIKRVFRTALTDTKTTDFEQVGTIRFEGNKVYKWVQFSGTTAVAAGKVVCYLATAGADLLETVVDGANSVIGAGIAQAAVAAGTVMFGWIQVTGPCVFAGTVTGAAGAGLSTNGATAGNLVVTTGVVPEMAYLLDATNLIILCAFPW